MLVSFSWCCLGSQFLLYLLVDILSLVVIIILIEVFEGTIPSKIILPFPWNHFKTKTRIRRLVLSVLSLKNSDFVSHGLCAVMKWIITCSLEHNQTFLIQCVYFYSVCISVYMMQLYLFANRAFMNLDDDNSQSR